MVFCCAEQWMGGLFHHIEPWGDGLRLGGTGAVTGVYCLPAVDQRRERLCLGSGAGGGRPAAGHRPADLRPRLRLPGQWGDWADLDQGLHSLGEDPVPALREIFGGPRWGRAADCLLRRTGRYLWLMAELTAHRNRPPGDPRRPPLDAGGITWWTTCPPSIGRTSLPAASSPFSTACSVIWSMPSTACPAGWDYGYARGELLRYLASWVCVEGADSDEVLRAPHPHRPARLRAALHRGGGAAERAPPHGKGSHSHRALPGLPQPGRTAPIRSSTGGCTGRIPTAFSFSCPRTPSPASGSGSSSSGIWRRSSPPA